MVQKKNVTNGTISDNFKSLVRIFKLVYRYKMILIAKTKIQILLMKC